LPVAEARAALNQVLRSPKTGQPALQYGITAGDTTLRQLTAEHLRKLDLQAASRLGVTECWSDGVMNTTPQHHNTPLLHHPIPQPACSSPAVRSNCST
jgi:DNA-binding transcriptional MocR family regulator